MKRQFSLTPEAKGDLREILLDIGEDSTEAAEKIRFGFYNEIKKLGRNPGIGHYHEELLSRKYRFWNFYNYVIVYAWDPKPIRIARVVHGARALPCFCHYGLARTRSSPWSPRSTVS